MTIYLTTRPSTLISYYLKTFKKVQFNLEVCNTWEELINITTRGPTLDENMELIPSINIVIPSFDKIGKELRHSVLNDTYITGVKLSNWKSLATKYDWISNLQLNLKEYEKRIDRLRTCLDSSAFNWFKDSYYNYPLKVEWESLHILIKYQEIGRRLTIEDLEIMYGFAKTYEFYNYLRHLGNQKASNDILNKLDNTTLWLGFIGKNTPFIYKEIIRICPEAWVLVDIFRVLFIEGRVDLSPGVFILNYLLNLVLTSRSGEGEIDRRVLDSCIEVLETI